MHTTLSVNNYYYCLLVVQRFEPVITGCSFLSATGLLGALWDGVAAFGLGGIRVVNGDHCSGIVEVNLHGEWGTVCDHGWDMQAANVVCLELGCGFAEFSHGAEFGPGSGLIALNSVQCTGHESSLIHCNLFLNKNSFCTHENDAGVKCTGGTTLC